MLNSRCQGTRPEIQGGFRPLSSTVFRTGAGSVPQSTLQTDYL